MQSAVLMLFHIGEREAAERLRKAIYRVYETRDHLTGDVGGNSSTGEFTAAVIRNL
jgi:isocitrate dehydrogenase (NAD+)